MCADATAVVHLAWAIHPRTDDPAMHRTNLRGSANLLRAAADAGVRQLVVASSVAAYGTAPRWLRVAEDWACTGVPGSAYSQQKALLESQLAAFERRNPSVALARVRPCAIMQRAAGGQFDRWLLSPLLPRWLVGQRWLPVPLWSDLRLQSVHADDVAAAIRLILRHHGTGAFNLAAEPVLTSRDIASVFGGFRVPASRDVLSALAWSGWRTGLQPLHPGWLRLADQVCLVDTGRARSELGWRPRHDPRRALAALADGMRRGSGAASAPLAPDAGWSSRRPTFARPSHQSQAERGSIDAIDERRP